MVAAPSRAAGPRGLPLVGSTFAAFADPYHFFLEVSQKFGDVIRIQFGPIVYHLLNDADAIKHVLVDNAKNYVKGWTYGVFKPLLGEGLLTSDGELWRRQRRLMQPAFHRDCLDGFATTMVNDASLLLQRWEALAPDSVVDIHSEFVRLAFRIVGRTLLGLDLETSGQEVAKEMRRALHLIDARATSIIRFPMFVPTPTNWRLKRVCQALDQVIDRILEEHRNHSTDQAGDLLSMLMAAVDESGQSMDRQQLRDELMTLVLAGTETTANLLTWTVLLLNQNPSAEVRVQEEIDRVLHGRSPTGANWTDLTYVQHVLEESMRLYPPAWKYERQALSEDSILGYCIPARSIVGITPHALHRNPKYWPEPDRFDPDRFLPDRVAPRPRYAYLPFGGGPRVCIGKGFAMMEAQIVLSMVMQRYRLEALAPESVEISPAITLHPRHGLKVRLLKR
jgi:cytochrome P450